MQEEKRQLRSMFDSLDVSHDGQISASELRSGLQRVGVSLPPHYDLVVAAVRWLSGCSGWSCSWG